jgi:SAM-dependent methyltransferase
MDSETQQPYISDASRPNAGRIYDYVLGGYHNFEIDRKMAEQIKQMAPFFPILAKLVRWFLGKAIRTSIERGFNQFLDFASGLPTVDHIHSIAPTNTKVIYSDIDPITVDYAKDIIGENEIVKYETCNAAEPEKLLESLIVDSLFGNNHKAAIGFNGICYFLTDEQVSHAMKVLYEWADEGSILFLSDYDGENLTEDFQSIINLYKNMNQPLYFRSKANFKEIIQPWKIEDPGLLSLDKWIDLSTTAIDESIRKLGGGGPFAGFLIK